MKIRITIFLSIIIAISITHLLWVLAEIPNRKNNNFNRIFIDDVAQPIASRKFNTPLQSILYFDESDVVFVTDSIGLLLKSNQFLEEIKRERLFLDKNDSDKSNRSQRVFIHGNQCFILSASSNKLTQFNTDASLDQTYKIPIVPIYTVSPVPGLFIFTSLRNEKTSFFSFSLPDETVNASETITLALDSTFHADGQLISDPITKWISYIPYYHNSVITFDTAFNTVSNFRTIDTISHDIVALRNSKSAPLVINQKSTSYNGFLFVASNLKADNESLTTYRKNIPIDVYNNSTGLYLGSFYIPLSNGKLIKSFLMSFYIPLSNGKLIKSFLILPNNVLFALYHDNRVISFHLNFEKSISNY